MTKKERDLITKNIGFCPNVLVAFKYVCLMLKREPTLREWESLGFDSQTYEFLKST